MKTTAPIPQTDWFPKTNEPAVIGRVVLVKVINEAESKKQRKEVYITWPAIEHKAAGLQGDISYALVREDVDPDEAQKWIRDFRKCWDAFKGAEAQAPEGTPLEDFDDLPEGIAKALQYKDVKTIEQLAHLSDATCEAIGIMGLRKYRAAAQRFLKKRVNHGYGYVQQG